MICKSVAKGRNHTKSPQSKYVGFWSLYHFKTMIYITFQPALAERISIDDESLMIDLVDGRSISVPLEWYPRLLHSTPQERNNWRLIGRGEGIHWPDLYEDISIENVWAGRPSRENQRSLKRWLEARKKV